MDALGNPLRFILMGGERNCIAQAVELIEGLEGEYLIADGGYDADEFRRGMMERGFIPVNRRGGIGRG